MSSSIIDQWIPRPPPMSRQDWRSVAVACTSRGYHANGVAMVRPSTSSTDRVSSLTLTLVARASCISFLKELIPVLQQVLPMFLNQLPDAVNFLAAKAPAALQAHGVE